MIRAGIIGGSGYTGLELIRLLLNHPEVEIGIATSRRFSGRKVSEIHPHLRGFMNLVYEDPSVSEVVSKSDIVYTAVPHGTAREYVPEILENGVKVIDLSADYRLSDDYGSVYGLSELHPEVKESRLVANPGCYSTGAVLAVAPLINEKIVERVVFDSKSGISGAGAEPTDRSHYPNLSENIIAYNVTSHRHRSEIVQELERFDEVKISFTPHVIPCARGILTTAHVFTSEKRSSEEVRMMYEEFYDGKHFIRIGRIPTLSSVRGTNLCDIGFEIEEGSNRIVVVSAIDNLIKGASGQAVQNMNIMFGLSERTGLWTLPWTP
jgi:N-acetyl-gamma-glutamyl-phosphate reductase